MYHLDIIDLNVKGGKEVMLLSEPEGNKIKLPIYLGSILKDIAGVKSLSKKICFNSSTPGKNLVLVFITKFKICVQVA